jgi:hypothetical protein
MVSSLKWSVGITLKPARGQPDTQADTVTGKPTQAASAVAGQLRPSPGLPGRLLLARGGAGPKLAAKNRVLLSGTSVPVGRCSDRAPAAAALDFTQASAGNAAAAGNRPC